MLSANCADEFDRFRSRAASLPNPDRIIPIRLRDTSDYRLPFSRTQEDRLAFLTKRKTAAWQTLTAVDQLERDNLCRTLGREIGSHILAIRSVPLPPSRNSPVAQTPLKPPHTVAVPISLSPVASGAFHMPRQSSVVCADLTFAGLSELTLPEGRFEFRVTEAFLTVSVEGPERIQVAGRFVGTGWPGPIALVHTMPIHGGPQSVMLRLAAHEDRLWGNPLVDPSEGGRDVELLWFDDHDAAPKQVTGSVVVLYRAVKVDVREPAAHLDADQEAARCANIACIAELLLERRTASLPLEGWTMHDGEADE